MVVHARGNTAQAKAKRALEAAGILIGKYEQVGFLLIGKGKKRKMLAAHRQPDSSVEWLIEGETELHSETTFLLYEEVAKHWESLFIKLDGVSDAV